MLTSSFLIFALKFLPQNQKLYFNFIQFQHQRRQHKKNTRTPDNHAKTPKIMYSKCKPETKYIMHIM